MAIGADVSEEREAVEGAAQDLLEMDAQMRESFARREARLLDAGLAEQILERHRTTVRRYEERFETLLKLLDELDAASRQRGGTDLPAAVRAARRYLKRHKAADPQRFLSQSNLPLSAIRVDAPVRDISQRQVASDKRRSVATAVTPRGEPLPADLAATIDVDLSAEASALVAELGSSPLALYRHVRDNFRFEPYAGSRKGSRETLLVQSGNAYDQASALIALLRSAGFPARYVAGTVLMPAAQVMDWLGVTDAATAANILGTAGLDPVAYTSGGQIVEIQFEHVWVSAYVPYGNYRGVPNDPTGSTWVALDPSFKPLAFAPAVDAPEAMGFDAEEFIDEYISTLHELSPVELYLERIEEFVAENLPQLSFPDDVFRNGEIEPYTEGVLPGSLPFTQLATATEFSEIAPADRHRIRFHIHLGDQQQTTLLDHTLNLPEIASRRTTISYDPATLADQAVIESYGDLYATPPDLIDLRPVLKIEGVAVATGNPIGAGVLHASDMHFLAPAQENNVLPVVQNRITAGTYQGIGIDTYAVPAEALINGPGESLPDADGLTGEKLYRTAMTYLNRVDQSGRTVAGTNQMVITTAVSEAIVENVVAVYYSLGTPVAWEWKGLIVDADRKIIGPFAIDGDDSESKAFFVLAGADGSILENRIFEDLYDEEAVSTIKILELASDMGIVLCRITTSIAVDCPGMSQPAPVVSAINAALAQGHEVTIPRAPLTYLNWSGTGYIDMDPDTGAAGYIISGGQSGGATVDVWTSPWALIYAVLGQDVCNITANILSPAPNSNFPYPGSYGGLGGTQPAQFVVLYTVYYCEDDPRDVTEVFMPHFQYPPGQFVFHAGWGTGATLPFTVFDVIIAPFADQHMGKGYTGAPVAGDPEPATITYAILPPSFVPAEVEMFINGGAASAQEPAAPQVPRGGALRTMTLPNAGGIQQAQFDGKTDGGTFLATGSYNVSIRVTSPDDKTDNSEESPLEVVEVISVEFVSAAGAPLDDNDHPVAPGGKRHFAGRQSAAAGSSNDEVTVRATLSAPVPAGRLRVYFASFDVVDPTGLIDANHAGFPIIGTPAEGSLDDSDPSSDGDDTVETDLTVTMQPGDNFKVFASTNSALIGNLTDALVESHTDAAGDTSDARLMPLASDRLTIWRRVHIERDSMGPVTGNVVEGEITNVAKFGAISELTTDATVTEMPSASTRFVPGLLRNDGNLFQVTDNTNGANIKVAVNNIPSAAGFTYPTEDSFTVVDDDDLDGNDGALLDGDDGEDVRNPTLALLSNSDDAMTNVYSVAYIRPLFDVGDDNSSVPFVLNTPDGADEEALLLGTYDFDQVATEADDEFWTVYLLGAYQMQTEEDADAEGGGTLGQVDEIHGLGASVFLETARDVRLPGTGCTEDVTVVHEVGHLFNLQHPEGGLMASPCNAGTSSFSNASLQKLRDVDHP
ncbi:MAG TPA: transglutaminase-like domain-containing protein [Candidatus Limnocylindrales bacterium]|nr:transglutaminase-like domain-containing protein [Candidatus Limnocylindrales bacterium]